LRPAIQFWFMLLPEAPDPSFCKLAALQARQVPPSAIGRPSPAFAASARALPSPSPFAVIGTSSTPQKQAEVAAAGEKWAHVYSSKQVVQSFCVLARCLHVAPAHCNLATWHVAVRRTLYFLRRLSRSSETNYRCLTHQRPAAASCLTLHRHLRRCWRARRL
jgi:hypothetical protein